MKNSDFSSQRAQKLPPVLITAIENYAHKTFKSHGLPAFVASREAAIAHEIGHAIVATAEGMIIQSVRVFSRSTPFGNAWGGWCADADNQSWTTGPDSSVACDLSRARIIIAGLAGEAMTGLDKPGSSVDELAVSQLIGRNAAEKLAEPMLSDAAFEAFAEQLWHDKVWDRAIAILRANRGPFQQLAGHLHRREKIKGGELRAILTQIRRITP